MRFLSSLHVNPDASQLAYAIFVIILIPIALAFNTLYLLRNAQKDIDFELNNKALLVESVIAIGLRDKISNAQALQVRLNEVTQLLPEVKAIEIFRSENGTNNAFVSTSPTTKSVSDSILNQLAWGSDQAFSKQIYASVGTGVKERMWLVASTLHDENKNKAGIINIYLSAAQIDEITNRTITQSLLILGATMIVVLLLLLNHFRFFEASILLRKLREVDELKDEFISIASHELKTPLTSINNYAYLLLQNALISSNAQFKKELDAISANAKRLGVLVNDILDVSRIEQNRITFTIQNNDLSLIITGIIDEFLPQAQGKGLQLRYENPTQALLIACDKDKTHQVFVNLIDNAIKYTPKGEIAVFHEIKERNVRTFVKDSGVGIAQEDMGKLFVKFSRIANEKTAYTTGTGLGLWITKQLVEKMGGKITVESIQHQGTQFVVSFPLAKG